MTKELRQPSPIIKPYSVAEAYDQVAAVYDLSYGQKKSLAENRLVIEALRALIGPYDQVLDLGCGTGFPLDQLEISPQRYLGVDISPKMIERARAKHPRHRFLAGDMCDLSAVSDHSINVLLSLFGGLSYVIEPERAIGEMRRVLAPGGRVYLMLLGRAYGVRSSYILNCNGMSVDRRLYTWPSAARRFSWLDDLRVTGLSCLIDYLPEWLPQVLFDAYLTAESQTLGRVLPSRNYFLVVSGRAS